MTYCNKCGAEDCREFIITDIEEYDRCRECHGENCLKDYDDAQMIERLAADYVDSKIDLAKGK